MDTNGQREDGDLAGKRRVSFWHHKIMPSDKSLIERLPENQRVLLQSQGQYRERAERFGIPVGTVRSRLHRARTALDILRQERDAASDDLPVHSS